MPGLLPLLAALVLTGLTETVPGRFSQPALAVVVVAGFALWTLLCLLGARAVARHGSFRALLLWDSTMTVAAVVAQAALCYGWGWSQRIPGMVPAVLPFVGLLLVHWWTMTAAVRAITHTPWTPLARVLHQVRFSILPPALMIIAIGDLADLTLRQIGVASPLWLEVLGVLGLGGGLLLFGPWLLVKLWGARPMPDSPLARRLAETCARAGVSVHALLRWPVPGGHMHNAVVFGLVPRFRYVLLTDDLLRDLDADEVVAVLGHELGHVRHGHLHLILLFALTVSGVGLGMWVSGDVGRLLELPGLRDLDGVAAQGVLMMAGLVLAWRVLFGVVSRACERQADLAGAEVGGNEAMQRALKSVARLSGQPEDAPSWRHHSIARRVAFLALAQRNVALADLHHRLVASMRFSLLVLLAVLALTTAWSYYATTHRDPVASLTAMARSDPALGKALAAADDDRDSGPLADWYGRAAYPARELLVNLHLDLCKAVATPATDAPADGDIDRAIYRFRHRLAAFVNVSSGNPGLDANLDNTLAYGLVAGAVQPTADDLALARSILPRLEAWQAKHPDHAVADTIACLHYVFADDLKARDGWTWALAELAKDRELDVALKARTQRLYGARLQAAQGAIATAGRTRAPLPLEWTPPPVAETAPTVGAAAPPPSASPLVPTP